MPKNRRDRNPLRALLLVDGLGSGGAQRQFAHLATGLAGRGHHVTVAVYNDQDHFAQPIRAAAISIVKLAKPSRFSPRPIVEFARLYRTTSSQVAIAFLRSPAAKAELARLLVPGMQIIAAERGSYPEGDLPVSLRVGQNLHRLARFVTANSAAQGQRMLGEFPWLADRIAIVGNGVALPAKIANPVATPGRPLRLVVVSSLMHYKNSRRLAQAIALLRDERGLTVEVDWVGETFGHLPGYGAHPETVALIDDLRIGDHWHWLGPRHDVEDIMRQHDALIHPSLTEGTSNAVCEAMALGLPVLAGSIADHERMIGRTGAGMTFDPLSVRSIADAIARFAALDEHARASMGSRGRSIIGTDYSFDAMVTGYERLARAAIRGAPCPSELKPASPAMVRPCAG